MNSLKVYSFKENIKKYIRGQGLPKEVVRMALAEIYNEIEKEAFEEILKEAEERERYESCTSSKENQAD